MRKVILESGQVVELSSEEIEDRLTRRFGLNAGRARQVSAVLDDRVSTVDALPIAELESIALELVGTLPEEHSREDLELRGGDLTRENLEPYVRELERLFGETHQVKRQGAGIKWEDGDSESDAPRLVGTAASQPLDCCRANVEGAAPGETVPGIRVTVHLSFTDRDSGDDASGLRKVQVRPMARPGVLSGSEAFFQVPGETWIPTDEERARSRIGSVSHVFVLCVPCSMLDRREARLAATAEDGAGNGSVQIVSVAIPDEIRRRCCEKPPTPVEPPTPITPTPPTPAVTPPPITGVRYYRVNLKLVMFIPYEPNTPPLFNRILPVWNGQMNGVEDPAMRALLAAGNPEPPDAFPDAQSFNAFVNSREYRGIVDWDFLICCDPNDGLVRVQTLGPTPMVGYTPTMSGVDKADLHRFHLDHESAASQIERLIQSGVPNAINTALGIAGVAGALPFSPGVAAAIRALDRAARGNPHANTPHPFTRGVLLPTPEVNRDNNRCAIRFSKTGVQVNAVENILYYLLTARLLPYMWGQLEVFFCCSGTLRVGVRGTAIPTKWLYVNNRKVAAYDMLQWPFNVIKQSVPFGPGNDAAFLDDPTAIQPPFAPEAPLPNATYSTTLPAKAGCPVLLPGEWIFE